jgi:hypothetical protein
MRNGVRSACLALITSRTNRSSTIHAPRAVALGWKLVNGALPTPELHALCAAAIAHVERGPAPWHRDPLRALLIEYRQVRRAAAGPQHALPAQRRRRVVRPVGCA